MRLPSQISQAGQAVKQTLANMTPKQKILAGVATAATIGVPIAADTIAQAPLYPIPNHILLGGVENLKMTHAEMTENTNKLFHSKDSFTTVVVLPGTGEQNEERLNALKASGLYDSEQDTLFTFTSGSGDWTNSPQPHLQGMPTLGRCPHNMPTTTTEAQNLALSSLNMIKEDAFVETVKKYTLIMVTSNPGNSFDAKAAMEKIGFKQDGAIQSIVNDDPNLNSKYINFKYPGHDNLTIKLLMADNKEPNRRQDLKTWSMSYARAGDYIVGLPRTQDQVPTVDFVYNKFIKKFNFQDVTKCHTWSDSSKKAADHTKRYDGSDAPGQAAHIVDSVVIDPNKVDPVPQNPVNLLHQAPKPETTQN
ncbi:MAG: hypothetical protein MK033_10210 [Candidatus Caenarcaniphilales bacterium]|nr:hypothetical protein [Candidatus Caenarcaniphilales bacterium]